MNHVVSADKPDSFSGEGRAGEVPSAPEVNWHDADQVLAIGDIL
jgi:hypothetical protein